MKGASTVTSGKDDTVGGGPAGLSSGRAGSDGNGSDGKAPSSVQALDREDSLDLPSGATTECSPPEALECDEVEVSFGRATAAGKREKSGEGTTRRDEGLPDVGARLSVFWDGEGQWFQGVAEHVDEKNGLVYVVYDDGDEVWESLGAGGKTAWKYAVDTRDREDGGRGGDRGTHVEVTPVVFKPVAKPTAVAAPIKRKRKSLVGVGDAMRMRLGSYAKQPGAIVSPTSVAAGSSPASTRSGPEDAIPLPTRPAQPARPARPARPAQPATWAQPAQPAQLAPPKRPAPLAPSAPPKKKHKRLQALIGDQRRKSLVESPQPGNVINHPRRALEKATNTPDSGPGGAKANPGIGIGPRKGTVAKTASKMAAPARHAPVATKPIYKRSGRTPAKPVPVKVAKAAEVAKVASEPPPRRKRALTLGDTHDLSSNPSDDEDDELDGHAMNDENFGLEFIANHNANANVGPAAPKAAFTARDAGDDDDIFALDALNQAIAKAVDSQHTLANKISHQKLSLLKREMKHALEEAHAKAKNRLAEVTHTSRVNCVIATDTLNTKIVEMDSFMNNQREAFKSLRRQAQALQKKAEETVRAGETRMMAVHEAEMGSLRKLHSSLNEKFVEGVAYIQNYKTRMGVSVN